MSQSVQEKHKRSLDFLAAATAQKITDVIGTKVGKPNDKEERKQVSSSNVENLTTKALGILQQQGIYAMFLFLLSRSGAKTDDKEINPEQLVACEMIATLFNTLQEPEMQPLGVAYPDKLEWQMINEHKKKLLAHLVNKDEHEKSLLGDLDTLFLVRDFYEQTLIYVRYGAKAAKEKK